MSVVVLPTGRRSALGDDYVGDHDLLAAHEGCRTRARFEAADDPLFRIYTSGTTGQPKAVKHTTGGYLAHAAWTSHAVLDIETEDTYWCSADIGWITGHSYIVYGPLALGTTTVMYDGTPTTPRPTACGSSSRSTPSTCSTRLRRRFARS